MTDKAPIIVWITSEFPFGDGEQFVAAEAEAWAAVDAKVVLLPEKRGSVESARAVPVGVEVSVLLADRWPSRRWQAWSAARALTSALWWREAFWLVRRRLATGERLRIALRTSAQVMLIQRTLRDLAGDIGGIDLVYGYWLSSGVFAGAEARRRGLVRHAACRAHGTDLWEPVRQAQYTPIVRQVAPFIDVVAAISESGREHLARYGFTASQRRLARLGVEPARTTCPPTAPGKLHVVSVSSITPLKRLDRLVGALAELARMEPLVEVQWTHIGDGPLRGEITALAEELLAPAHVSYRFAGHLTHDAVLDWYATHNVDVVVNTSDSEGVPVSLMEAMARGVPAVAPRVGAVDELVPPSLLLPAHADDTQVAGHLAAHVAHFKSEQLRGSVRDIVDRQYSAAPNHAAFVASLERLARA